MLLELRTALQDEQDNSVRGDIRALLRALRDRRDITYATVQEIDSILDKDAAGAADLGQTTVGSGSDESTVRSSQDTSHAAPSRAAETTSAAPPAPAEAHSKPRTR